MAWLILFAAGVLEIGWAVGLKYTDGFTRLWPTVATVAAMASACCCWAWRSAPCPSARHMPSGRALALSGQCCSASALFGEPADAAAAAFIAMIVAGIVGLKLVDSR